MCWLSVNLLPQTSTALKEVYEEDRSIPRSTLATLHCLQLLNGMPRDAPENTVLGDKVQTVQVALTAFNHEVEQRAPRQIPASQNADKAHIYSLLYVSKEPEKLQTRMLLWTYNKRGVLHIWLIFWCYEST